MTAPAILEALADGAYVTDTNRRILSGNKAAERSCRLTICHGAG